MGKMLIAFIAAMCVGCSDGGIVGSSTVTGNYKLIRINDSPLPYTTSAAVATKTEIVDDVISLYEGFTFAEVIHTRVTVSGQATTSTAMTGGSYSLLGNSISFLLSTGGPTRSATISADVMTRVDPGLTFVYKK